MLPVRFGPQPTTHLDEGGARTLMQSGYAVQYRDLL
ncbi:hypothetical protein PC116_g16747 [Phytophthora cactorum]|nr:hypothetical protein PC116_g16747 [Phytophthora cactorum]